MNGHLQKPRLSSGNIESLYIVDKLEGSAWSNETGLPSSPVQSLLHSYK